MSAVGAGTSALLTRGEKKLFRFLSSHMEANGIAPTCEELGAALGIKSRSNIHRILHSLEKKGLIRMMPRRARAIELVKPVDHHIANCLCATCNPNRYRDTFKLIKAVEKDLAPGFIFAHSSFNLRLLPEEKRAALLGVAIRSRQSTAENSSRKSSS